MKAIHSLLLLLATRESSEGSFRLERLAPGVVAAATAGDGSLTNPKITPNEDSLAVVELPTGTAALIADAHFGPSAGETSWCAASRKRWNGHW